MILIISFPSDLHTQEVARFLVDQGHTPFLLDFSHFTTQAWIKLGFAGQETDFVFHDQAWGEIDLTQVRAVWWRRPQQFQISSAVSEPQQYMFAVTEAREVFGGLPGLLDAYWMNVPERDDLAHRKVFQLRAAQRLGLEMPETLITNSPEAAREFIAKRGPDSTVFKAFSGTPQSWRETRVVGKAELDALDAVSYTPVIFQEYVRGTDIRVTVVGRHLFAAEIDIATGDYPIDFRMNYESLQMGAIDLPSEVERGIRSLMTNLGLVYGAIDFRKTPDNRFVFLEINPAGQWLFVERHTQQPITEAVANTLLELDLN